MTGTREANATLGIPVSPYARRHPRTVFWVRIAVAAWLVALTGVFCALGYYWGAALLAPAALHVWLAWRVRAQARGQH